MSNDVKPVDLVAIRARIERGGHAVNAILYHDAPAMADEIERLREAIRIELEYGDLEGCYTRPDLRKILP